MTVERTVVVEIAEGLHARPAARLVQAAARYASQIELQAHGKTMSAKSLVGVLRLAVRRGDVLTIRASGEDEQRAVDEIGGLLSTSPEPPGDG